MLPIFQKRTTAEEQARSLHRHGAVSGALPHSATKAVRVHEVWYEPWSTELALGILTV